MLKKIVVIGPESTGKSTLCTLLAQQLNCFWCKEYAREYLTKNGIQYTFNDLNNIAKGQLKDEDIFTKEAINKNHNHLIIDTDMYVIKVWSEFVFNQCSPFIIEEISKRKYDLYLLCNVDLPWVKDDLREYPDNETRQKLFSIYKEILLQQSTPFVIISGNYEQRLQAAITAIKAI